MRHANKPVGRVLKVQTATECDAICQLQLLEMHRDIYRYILYLQGTEQYFTLPNQMLHGGSFLVALFAPDTALLL